MISVQSALVCFGLLMSTCLAHVNVAFRNLEEDLPSLTYRFESDLPSQADRVCYIIAIHGDTGVCVSDDVAISEATRDADGVWDFSGPAARRLTGRVGAHPRELGGYARAHRSGTYDWINGVLPYEFDPAFPVERIPQVNSAIQYMNKTIDGLRLLPNSMVGAADAIKFVSDGGCWSYVGRVDGIQSVSIDTGCGFQQTVHEIMHAIGFQHEHTRTDRDDYVSINFDRVQTGKEGNFDIVQCDTSLPMCLLGATPYDYLSIMHYSRTAFSNVDSSATTDERATIDVVPSGFLSAGFSDMSELPFPIGDGDIMSPHDVTDLTAKFAGCSNPAWDVATPCNTIRIALMDGSMSVVNGSFNYAGDYHTAGVNRWVRSDGFQLQRADAPWSYPWFLYNTEGNYFRGPANGYFPASDVHWEFMDPTLPGINFTCTDPGVPAYDVGPPNSCQMHPDGYYATREVFCRDITTGLCIDDLLCASLPPVEAREDCPAPTTASCNFDDMNDCGYALDADASTTTFKLWQGPADQGLHFSSSINSGPSADAQGNADGGYLIINNMGTPSLTHATLNTLPFQVDSASAHLTFSVGTEWDRAYLSSDWNMVVTLHDFATGDVIPGSPTVSLSKSMLSNGWTAFTMDLVAPAATDVYVSAYFELLSTYSSVWVGLDNFDFTGIIRADVLGGPLPPPVAPDCSNTIPNVREYNGVFVTDICRPESAPCTVAVVANGVEWYTHHQQTLMRPRTECANPPLA